MRKGRWIQNEEEQKCIGTHNQELKTAQIRNAGGNVEKRELSYTVCAATMASFVEVP